VVEEQGDWTPLGPLHRQSNAGPRLTHAAFAGVVDNATKHLARLNIPFAMVDTPARTDSEVCGVHERLFDSNLMGNAQSAFAEHWHTVAVDREAAHSERTAQPHEERNQWQASSKLSTEKR
jgi:hypothetical protein